MYDIIAKYAFKVPVETNLTNDLKSNKIYMKNSEEFLKYVVECLNGINRKSYGHSSHDIRSYSYLITVFWDTDGRDIYALINIHAGLFNEISDVRPTALWLGDMNRDDNFPNFFDSFMARVKDIVNKELYYPLCAGWSFERTKFVDAGGNDVPFKFSESANIQTFTIKSSIHFNDLGIYEFDEPEISHY